jgi:sulfate adenylyltransferase subunit 2
MNHLDKLEAEAIYVIREAIENLERPVLLFSGGKDSITLFHLIRKAYAPGPFPIPLLQIDTGHNFPEAIEFRDALAKKYKLKMHIGYVQDYIDQGKVVEKKGPKATRNQLQVAPLIDIVREKRFGVCFGGARRDEEKARAKERFFSLRENLGGWDPNGQRPELWDLYNHKKNDLEHFRVFPLSNWTELDIWEYIKRENIELPSLYFSHSRLCLKRKDGKLLAMSPYIQKEIGEDLLILNIRFRTIGDMTCTAAVESHANSIDDVIKEIKSATSSERGSSRVDDEASDTAMEDRKKVGYF